MIKARMLSMTVALAAALAAAVPAAAAEDVPEAACWDQDRIAPAIAGDTQGFIELGTRPEGPREVGAWVHTGDGWELHRMLDLLEDTLPTKSLNCMRAPAWGYAAGGHYPIVETSGHHLRVVIDPVQDWRVWLDRRALEKEFFVTVRMEKSGRAPLAGR